MLGYLAVLLVISLTLVAILSYFKKHIPLHPWIIYSAVGISFVLGSVFPLAISTLTPGKVVSIYFSLIILIATVLSYAESRVCVNASPTPLKIADLEEENSTGEPVKDSFSSILAEETAALEACAAMDHSSDTDKLPEDPEAGVDLKMDVSAQNKDDSLVDISTDYQHQTTTDDLAKEDTPPEEELPLKFNLSVEETLIIEDISAVEAMSLVKEEPSVKTDLSESTDVLTEEEMLFDTIQDPDGTRLECPAYEDFSSYDKPPGEDKLPDQSKITELEEPLVWEEPKYEDLIAEKDLLPQNRDKDEEVIEDYPRELATTTKGIEIFPDGDKFPSNTVNDYVSSGFRAKSAGDLAGAINYFITALQANQEQQITAAIALEISSIYQELGQYFQAELILKSVVKQINIINNFSLRQKIQGQLIYLDTLCELLRIAKITNSPYSKIPNTIKIKASLETAEKLKEITQGGITSEKQ